MGILLGDLERSPEDELDQVEGGADQGEDDAGDVPRPGRRHDPEDQAHQADGQRDDGERQGDYEHDREEPEGRA